jgi:hypothetical protein
MNDPPVKVVGRTPLRRCRHCCIVRSMSAPYENSRRAVYRVVYPVMERPTFALPGETFPVLDCSELGMRYESRDHRPELGSTLAGVVRFRRGAEVPVTGEVIRVEKGTIAIWFGAQGIPLSEVLAERAYLSSASENVK